MTNEEARVVLEMLLEVEDTYVDAVVIAHLAKRLPDVNWQAIADALGEA